MMCEQNDNKVQIFMAIQAFVLHSDCGYLCYDLTLNASSGKFLFKKRIRVYTTHLTLNASENNNIVLIFAGGQCYFFKFERYMKRQVPPELHYA